MTGLKMRGIPWKTTVQDIEQFFQRYAFVRGSIRIGERSNGKSSGQAVLLFVNETETVSALNEMKGMNIGHRYVELYQIPYAHYQSFLDDEFHQRNPNMTDKTVCLNDFVNADNQNQYVKLRGLPFSATT